MKIHVSHIDLDGIFPYVIDDVFNIEYDESISANYNDDSEYELFEFLSKLTNDDVEIVYTDFSPNEKFRELFDKHDSWKISIFDHHENIFNELYIWAKNKTNVNLYLDVNRCGTKIYYDFHKNNFNKNNVLDYQVELVNTYDLFNKKSEFWNEAENLNRLMYYMFDYSIDFSSNAFIKYQPFIQSMIYKAKRNNNFYFVDFENEKIKRSKNKDNELKRSIDNKTLEVKFRKDKNNNTFAIFKSSKKISLLSDYILTKYPRVNYVIAINTFDNDNYKISARCLENKFNTLTLKGFKGHVCASGYKDDNLSNEFCMNLYNGLINSFDIVNNIDSCDKKEIVEVICENAKIIKFIEK